MLHKNPWTNYTFTDHIQLQVDYEFLIQNRQELWIPSILRNLNCWKAVIFPQAMRSSEGIRRKIFQARHVQSLPVNSIGNLTSSICITNASLWMHLDSKVLKWKLARGFSCQDQDFYLQIWYPPVKKICTSVFMPSREAAIDMSSEVEAFSDELTLSPSIYAIILSWQDKHRKGTVIQSL